MPIATLFRDHAGTLAVGDLDYVLRWTTHAKTILISVLHDGAVVGAGVASHAPDVFEPDSADWRGEITVHGVQFGLHGASTAAGLRLSLEGPRCPHSVDRNALPPALRELLAPVRERADVV